MFGILKLLIYYDFIFLYVEIIKRKKKNFKFIQNKNELFKVKFSFKKM